MEHGRRNSLVNSLIWLKGCDLSWKIPEVQACKNMIEERLGEEEN